MIFFRIHAHATLYLVKILKISYSRAYIMIVFFFIRTAITIDLLAIAALFLHSTELYSGKKFVFKPHLPSIKH